MVRVKMMSNGGVALIDNQKVQVFDKFGNCDTSKYDAITPRYTQGMQNLPVLSVLSSRSVSNQTEIALFNVNDTMEKYVINKSAIDIVSLLQGNRDFVKTLQRSGKENGIRYNQFIIIYPLCTNLRDKITNFM